MDSVIIYGLPVVRTPARPTDRPTDAAIDDHSADNVYHLYQESNVAAGSRCW